MVRNRRLHGQRGFTLIDMLFVVGLVGLLSTLALPGIIRARGAAQSSSALGTMRAINSGQLSFAITCASGFYAPALPILGVRPAGSPAAFLPDGLTGGATIVRHGYSFTLSGTALPGAPATCNGLGVGQTAPGYAILADPLQTDATSRYFGTNADGILYEHSATLNGVMPEAGVPIAGAPVK